MYDEYCKKMTSLIQEEVVDPALIRRVYEGFMNETAFRGVDIESALSNSINIFMIAFKQQLVHRVEQAAAESEKGVISSTDSCKPPAIGYQILQLSIS